MILFWLVEPLPFRVRWWNTVHSTNDIKLRFSGLLKCQTSSFRFKSMALVTHDVLFLCHVNFSGIWKYGRVSATVTSGSLDVLACLFNAKYAVRVVSFPSICSIAPSSLPVRKTICSDRSVSFLLCRQKNLLLVRQVHTQSFYFVTLILHFVFKCVPNCFWSWQIAGIYKRFDFIKV